jgi:hypothetical protein
MRSSFFARAASHDRVRRRLGVLGLVLSLGLGVGQREARAEGSAADRTTARALAEEGYKALTAKDYSLAEDRFRRADALVHAPSLVVDHARALVGLGRFADAYESYDSARREVLPPNAPQAWRRAVSDAQREIQSVEAKIAWVTIAVRGPKDPQVNIDGREVPSFALGSAFPSDIGARVVHVSAPGFIGKDVTVTLSPGERQQVILDLEPEPAAVPVAPPVIEKHVTRQAPAAPPPPRKTSPLTYVAFGVGGALLAQGAVTGLLFLSERSKLESQCPSASTCPPSTRDERSRYHFYSYVSSISVVAGLAGVGAGVYLLLSKPKSPPTDAAKVAVVPYVGPGSVGLEGRF